MRLPCTPSCPLHNAVRTAVTAGSRRNTPSNCTGRPTVTAYGDLYDSAVLCRPIGSGAQLQNSGCLRSQDPPPESFQLAVNQPSDSCPVQAALDLLLDLMAHDSGCLREGARLLQQAHFGTANLSGLYNNQPMSTAR